MSAPVSATLVNALVVVLFALHVAACGPGSGCTCVPCTTAVTLTVIDGQTAGPITTFVLDAQLNGDPIGQPPECEEDARTGNSCSFGRFGGLYHLVIGAPGYETRETLVRLPDRLAGDACCPPFCLTSQEVTVALDPF